MEVNWVLECLLFVFLAIRWVSDCRYISIVLKLWIGFPLAVLVAEANDDLLYHILIQEFKIKYWQPNWISFYLCIVNKWPSQKAGIWNLELEAARQWWLGKFWGHTSISDNQLSCTLHVMWGYCHTAFYKIFCSGSGGSLVWEWIQSKWPVGKVIGKKISLKWFTWTKTLWVL